jgi:signal transduction histidine kinase
MSSLPLTSLITVVEHLPLPVVVTNSGGFVVGRSESAAGFLGDWSRTATTAPSLHLGDHLATLPVPPLATGRTLVDCDDGPHELVGLLDTAQIARVPKDVATLAGEVAHEFNNLLGVIINFASLAAADVPAGSSASQDLQEVMVASRRAAVITGRLMDMGRGIVRHPLDGLASEASAFLPRATSQGLPAPSAGASRDGVVTPPVKD